MLKYLLIDMKLIVTFLFLSFSLPIYSQSNGQLQPETHVGIATDTTDEPWIGPITQEVRFKGVGNLRDFINDSLSKEFKKFIEDKNIHGKIFCDIVIDKTGKVKQVKIVKGSMGSYIDEEIKRVIKLTTWYPATYNEKPVIRRAMLPIGL